MKLCIAYMMYTTTHPRFSIDNYLTKFRSFLTFCYLFIVMGQSGQLDHLSSQPYNKKYEIA